jgi:uncharacterized protein YhaN
MTTKKKIEPKVERDALPILKLKEEIADLHEQLTICRASKKLGEDNAAKERAVLVLQLRDANKEITQLKAALEACRSKLAEVPAPTPPPTPTPVATETNPLRLAVALSSLIHAIEDPNQTSGTLQAALAEGRATLAAS